MWWCDVDVMWWCDVVCDVMCDDVMRCDDVMTRGGALVMWTLLGMCRSKGHYLRPDSLAKGVFLANIPQPRVYFSSEVLSQGYIFDKNT